MVESGEVKMVNEPFSWDCRLCATFCLSSFIMTVATGAFQITFELIFVDPSKCALAEVSFIRIRTVSMQNCNLFIYFICIANVQIESGRWIRTDSRCIYICMESQIV